GNRNKFDHVKHPILNHDITRLLLTPNLSSLAPFQSNLCTENDLFAVMLTAWDQTEWAVSTAKKSFKPLTTLQHLCFGSYAFNSIPEQSTRHRQPHTHPPIPQNSTPRPSIPISFPLVHKQKSFCCCNLSESDQKGPRPTCMSSFTNLHSHDCVSVSNTATAFFHASRDPLSSGKKEPPISHELRNVRDGLRRVRGAVNAERIAIVKPVHLRTNRDIASTGRHNVETEIITSLGVAEDGIDASVGEAMSFLKLLETRERVGPPSSMTTSHDSILPQTSPPWRLSKAISAQQMTCLPSCFSGKKRASFFSPHFTALDHFDWAHSDAKNSSKPLTTLQRLCFGSYALNAFSEQSRSSTTHALTQSLEFNTSSISSHFFSFGSIGIPVTFHANLILHHHRIRPKSTNPHVFFYHRRLPHLRFCIKHHHCFTPRHPTIKSETGITDQVNLPVDDISNFTRHGSRREALRHVRDGLHRVGGTVNAEGINIVEHVHLRTHRDKASTGRHGRERSDDDQAVSRVEFPDVETAVTRVAVAEKSVETLRSPLVELRRVNEFPELLGDEGECRVVASGHTSYDVKGDVVWK
ncbi:LOW QUALITY PROTEIN: hypothetical protein HID58_052794, partial [Brassica napus]